MTEKNTHRTPSQQHWVDLLTKDSISLVEYFDRTQMNGDSIEKFIGECANHFGRTLMILIFCEQGSSILNQHEPLSKQLAKINCHKRLVKLVKALEKALANEDN